jgi:hypothetical protein
MPKGSSSIHQVRIQPFGVTPPVLATLVLAFALSGPALAAPADAPHGPDLADCPELQVPEGNTLVLRAFGVGVQIYRWNGTTWAFVAPQALLFADAAGDGVVAIHFGGPTWECVDGCEVVGSVIESCSPDPSAIPWLLLTAASTKGPGLLDRLTYIQRLDTVGGKAPSVPGAFPGQVVRVPYSADYLFYRSDH